MRRFWYEAGLPSEWFAGVRSALAASAAAGVFAAAFVFVAGVCGNAIGSVLHWIAAAAVVMAMEVVLVVVVAVVVVEAAAVILVVEGLDSYWTSDAI